MLQPSTLDERL